MRRKEVSTQFWGLVTAMVALTSVLVAQPLQRPWVGAVFFYWYEWDEEAEWGNWLGAVHNTPLNGYYDNRKLKDNFRSLLLAADWGLTHFFLDYWGHDWRGENNEPRETTVLKAAEKVRSLGYPIFIGYYQDGENFAMREFWRNVSERRDTYRWLRDYARFPAWTWLFGKPFQMVYARNGVPELIIDHTGFQAWLRQRYGSIERLNAEWGTQFRDFSEIRMDFNAVGFQRAMSIAFQYERWQQDWAKLEQLIRDELKLPGLRVSLDVGYAPFRGFGFERFARTFGGPHSYGGIFGQPHEQDAERFLQAAVARKVGTVFFDHLKHRYFDWNIRVPGTAYPPEPHHFDRFWVGNLMRFVDGVLHLSWNEWWEGSNLEPSFEGGKRFCETNLLYSTLWQIVDRGERRGARLTGMGDEGWGTMDSSVGLLVNDWIFEHGGGEAGDLYRAVQGLRAVNAPFDIVLQSEATLENLKRFRVLVAPAGGVGFGFNAANEPIGQVLSRWLALGNRWLLTSQGSLEAIGHKVAQQQTKTLSPVPRPSPHPFNFFADIGAEGDEFVLLQGFSGREDWGKLPEGALGAGTPATVRWTPAIGNTTTLMLPVQTNTDLLLRWQGTAIWHNRIQVFVNEQFVAEVEIEPGWRVYAVPIPAAVIRNAQVVEVAWKFAAAHVPGEKEPQRFPGEQRVCNLALDWVQICQPEVPVGERKGVAWRPTGEAAFVNPLTGSFRIPLQRRRAVVPKGQVISVYRDGIPRDLLVVVPSPTARPSSLLFVNGVFTDSPRWWATVLEQLVKVPCGKFAVPDRNELPDHPEVMSAALTAGATRFLLVENRSGTKQRLKLHLPVPDQLPVSEILALSKDGKRFELLKNQSLPFADAVEHYAAYQIVFAPVQLSLPKWTAFPGQRTSLPITVRNLTDQPLRLTLRVTAVIASIRGKGVTVRLKPKEQRTVMVPIEVQPFADWGLKTVVVQGTWSKGRGKRGTAVWLRPLLVGRNATVRCLTTTVTSHTPTLTLINEPTTPFGDVSWWHPAKEVPGETARDVEVVAIGLTEQPTIVKVGDLREGERKQVSLPIPFHRQLIVRSLPLFVRWRDSAGQHEQKVNLVVALLPQRLPKRHPDQVATVLVPDGEGVIGLPLAVRLPEGVKGGTFLVRLPDGTPLPTHTDQKRQTVHFVLPSMTPRWRVDIGAEGDEKVLLRGFSFREVWAGGLTIRWLPSEGLESVLLLPVALDQPYRLRLHGQAFGANRVTLFVDEKPVGEFALRPGWQTLTVPLPALPDKDPPISVRLVFEQAHIPAEKVAGSTDRRVCNFALDWVELEPAFEERVLLLSLCRAEPKQIPTPLSVEASEGVVRVDNGALQLEWRTDAGGTLTKFLSKATGRDYAAKSFGIGVGVFGRFDPNRPAVTTNRFVLDEFVWQRESKATVRLVECNPVWALVETRAEVEGVEVVQRYRIFAGSSLVELSVAAAPSSALHRLPPDTELVAVEARLSATWWTKTFPNFVGLGDQPPEVYGGHIVHFGWRMGDWLPPVLCLFHPNDLTETLSLLVLENEGINAVRQGFWGEQRGKPANKRQFATIELAAKPCQPVRTRLWIWLHEGHYAVARQRQQHGLYPSTFAVP